MILKKKQIKVALDILEKSKKHRPVLSTMSIQEIDGETRLCFTDSYMVASWKLDSCKRVIGKGITYEDLEAWYKKANGRDYINENWVLLNARFIPDYPGLDSIINKHRDEKPISKMMINAGYLMQIQLLAGDFVKMTFTGDYSPIRCTYKDFFGIVLPIRSQD